MKKQFLVCTTAALALSGCATTEGYRQHMDMLVGQSADAVQLQWGVPERSKLDNGSEMWVYRRDSESHSGGYMSEHTRTRKESYTDKDGKTQTRTITTSTPYYVPETVTRTHCETRFVIGADRRVASIAFEGDGCVAEEVKKDPAMQEPAAK